MKNNLTINDMITSNGQYEGVTNPTVLEDMNVISNEFNDSVSNVLKVEDAISQLENTNSPEVIAHILKTEGLVSDEFKVESAIEGRAKFLERLKDFANKTRALHAETFGAFSSAAKGFKAAKKYDDLEAKLKDPKYVAKDKLTAKDLKAIGVYTAVFTALGYDISKSNDIIKFLEEIQTFIDDIHSEVSDFMNAIWSTDAVTMITAGSLGTMWKEGKLATPKTLAFLKRLDIPIKKDRILVTGLPFKMIHNTLSLLLVTYEEKTGKIHVDTDVIPVKDKLADKALSIADLKDIVKAADKLRAVSKKNMDKVFNSAKKMNVDGAYSDGKWETESELTDGSATQLIISNITAASKLRSNYFLVSKNLTYVGSDVRLMVDALVNRTLEKK